MWMIFFRNQGLIIDISFQLAGNLISQEGKIF